MALPDFTGQNIENTYQRVLQTDGGDLRDGTGSLVTLTNITASGNISSSGTIHANRYIEAGANINSIYSTIASPTFTGAITASGNISSSGTITATSFVGTMDGGSF